VAITLTNLGIVLKNLGDFEGAKKIYERALEINEKAYGKDHPKTANVRNILESLDI
jgi:tetratricopeptide (TPR) repeat protein